MSLPPDLADVWEMRPKLRHDVVFLDAPAGAYLRGADTAFLLKGRSAFRWLSTLSPYLTGEHSVGQLCAELDDGQRRTVATLIRALTARGFVKDVPRGSPVPAVVARRFASQIEFIDHFADDAPARFLQFHQSRTVLGGTGPALLAATLGLLRNGCLNLRVHPEQDADAYREAVRAEVEELRAEGFDPQVEVTSEPVTNTDADVLVYCADSTGLPRLLALARRCHEQGPLLIPVFWDGRRAVLGPSSAAGEAPCWLCAQLRLNANAEPTAAARSWRHLAIGPVAVEDAACDEVAAQMIGNAAAFEVFRIRTGALPADTGSSVVVIDLTTLESTRERLLRHPACPVCREVADDAGQPDAARLTEEQIYQRAEVLVSPNAGVFTQFVDDPLEQAPLKTARLRVPGSDGARHLTAFDVHTLMAARMTAYRIAVRDYVGRLGSHPEAVQASAAELAATGRQPVPWALFDTATGAVPYSAHRRLTWLPARRLDGAGTAWVPAAMALPFAAANQERYAERTHAGAAVGSSVDEVVADGLMGALAHNALGAVLRGRAGVTPIAEADLIAHEELALIVKAAHRFGQQIQAFTLPAAAPVSVVLARTVAGDGAKPAWQIAAARSAQAARLHAVRDLVGRVQVRHFEGAEADLGDPLSADFDPRTLPAAADQSVAVEPQSTSDPEPTVDEVLAALTAKGLSALLVETTTPDIRATGALVSGVVLLHRAAPAAD